MKKVILLFLFWANLLYANAQCTINAESLSGNSVLCGDSVRIRISGTAISLSAQAENFNNGLPQGWTTSQQIMTNNPCSPSGVDGTPHIWMGNNAGVPRIIETATYDLSSVSPAINLCVDLLYPQQGLASPCEGPDEPLEGVYLQYSIDNGSTWIPIHYFDPLGGQNPQLTNWNNWCFPLPQAALVQNVIFRFIQLYDSGPDFDHWGIDNFNLNILDPNYNISFPDGYSLGIGNYSTASSIMYYPNNDTLLIFTMTDGTNTCADTIELNVIQPQLYVDAGVDTLWANVGDCVTLSANASNIRTPAIGTKTFTSPYTVNFTPNSTSTSYTSSITVAGVLNDTINANTLSSICFGNLFAFAFFPNPNTYFEVWLFNPSGDSINLLNRSMGSNFSGSNLCFSETATAIANSNSLTGDYLPNESFQNLFNGNVNGTWLVKYKVQSLGGAVINILSPSVNLNFNEGEILGDYLVSWSPATNITNGNTLTPTICTSNNNIPEQYIITIEDPLGCALPVSDTVVIIKNNNLVWPGDANDDLIADNNDLLMFGLYYGMSSSARDSISNLWIGHESLNWIDTLYNGSNLKHADCDGDGIINDSDTLAINLNYGLTHVRSGGFQSRAGEPVLLLQPNQSTYLPGDTVIIDIMLGDNDIQVNNFYGIAFDLNYDNTLVQQGSVSLNYSNSFIGNVSDNLKLSKIFENLGKADGAIVRKDQQTASGYGKIGDLRFIARNDINTLEYIQLAISEYYAIDANGDSILFDVYPTTDIEVDGRTIGLYDNNIDNQFEIYPNPFTQSTNISYTLSSAAQVQLKVKDILGRTITETSLQTQSAGKHQMHFSNEPAKGILFVELSIDGNKAIKRMVKIN